MAKFPELRLDVPDLTDEFKIFRQRMELCFEDHAITDIPKQAKKSR